MDMPTWCDGVNPGNSEQFQLRVVQHVCSLNWKPSQAASIVSALREFKLSEGDLDTVIQKVLICCSGADLQSIPALVYQLLLASLQGKGEVALKGIARHFDRVEKKQWTEASASRVGPQQRRRQQLVRTVR